MTETPQPPQEPKLIAPEQPHLQLAAPNPSAAPAQPTSQKTERLYEQDAYVKQFKAKVLEVSEQGDNFQVLLDSTAFYPGGGGQESDRGHLEAANCLAKVLDVFEKGGAVWHVCEFKGALAPGESVEGFIDWPRRHAMMKYHTAEHTLFHCMLDLFKGLEMVKVQITPEGASIFVKYPGELEMSQVLEAEMKANSILSRQLQVTLREFKKDALPQGTRAKLERIDSDVVRVVQVGDFDSCACAGLHVKNTGEVGMLTVSNITSEGAGQYKISFLVGEDAQDYLLQTKLACDKACSILQTTSDKLEKTAVNLKAQKEKLEQAVKTLNEKILDEMQPARIGSYNLYSKSLSNMDNKKLMERAGELIKTGRTIVLISNKEGEKGFLLIAKSMDVFIDLKFVANRAFPMMSGKGGGQDNFISGAGEAAKLGAAFEFAESELTKKLSG